MLENLDFCWHCSKCKQTDALLRRIRRLSRNWGGLVKKKKKVWPTCITWLTSLTWTSWRDVSDDPRLTSVTAGRNWEFSQFYELLMTSPVTSWSHEDNAVACLDWNRFLSSGGRFVSLRFKMLENLLLIHTFLANNKNVVCETELESWN